MAANSDTPEFLTDLQDGKKIADFFGVSYRTVGDSITELTQKIMSKMYVRDAENPFDIARNAKIEAWYQENTGRPWGAENSAKTTSAFLFGPPGHGKSIAFRLASRAVAKALGMRFIDNSTLQEDGKIDLPAVLPAGLEDQIQNNALPYPPANEVGPNDFIFLTYEMSGEVAKGDFGGPPDIRSTQVSYVVKDEHGRVQYDEQGKVAFATREERYSTRAMPWMLTAFKKAGGGYLLLDDFTNAASYIQNIGLGLFQNNAYQGITFPKNISIGGTGNLGAVDGTYAEALSTAAKGRLDAHYTQDSLVDYVSRIDQVFDPVETPSRNMFAHIVGNFMRDQPHLFAQLPPGNILYLKKTGARVTLKDIKAKLTHPNEQERWTDMDVEDHIGEMPSPGGQGYPSPRNWDNAINELGRAWLMVPAASHPKHLDGLNKFAQKMLQQLTSDVGPEAANALAPVMQEQLLAKSFKNVGEQLVERPETLVLPEGRLAEAFKSIVLTPRGSDRTTKVAWVVSGGLEELQDSLLQKTADDFSQALQQGNHPIRNLIKNYIEVCANTGDEDVFERGIESLFKTISSKPIFEKAPSWTEADPSGEQFFSGNVRALLDACLDNARMYSGDSLSTEMKNIANGQFEHHVATHDDLPGRTTAKIQAGQPLAGANPWDMRAWLSKGAIPAAIADNMTLYPASLRQAWADAFFELGGADNSVSSPLVTLAAGVLSSMDPNNCKALLHDKIHDLSNPGASASGVSSDEQARACRLLVAIENQLSGNATQLQPLLSGWSDDISRGWNARRSIYKTVRPLI